MTTLPKEFLLRMQDLLKDEYEDFLESYDRPHHSGLRINTGKAVPEECAQQLPFPTEPIPWTTNGFYYPQGERPARHPYYACGVYYLQEPSAMVPASLLPIEPGDCVLDLCAAPGGKATELGAKLCGEGLLVANDISNARAKALLRNIELFGISNALVTNETPQRLSTYFPGYFHKILVDAPCSGEGMFRKDEALAAAWYPQKPAECAALQREILTEAVSMLMPGGLLLYSTCTFSPQENEGTLSWLLSAFPELSLQPVSVPEDFGCGVPAWGDNNPQLAKAVRIWPHRSAGEGHFAALLKKEGTAIRHATPTAKKKSRLKKEEKLLLEDFFKNFTKEIPWERIEIRADKAYLMPPCLPDIRGLNFLRGGLFLGELKKNRFEPSQPLALSLKKEDYSSAISLHPEDTRLTAYLRGETIPIKQEEAPISKGWQLLCADNYPLGWGKLVNGTLKNKYPSGWRK